MTGIALFVAEPTGTCRLVLRRFRHRDGDGHFHDATVVIEEDVPVTLPGADGTRQHAQDRVSRDDPRWPAACDCGEPFTPGDEWQVNELDWYEGAGHRFAWGIGSWSGPAGAMIRTPWRDVDGRPPAWMVFLPNGQMWSTNERASVPGSNQAGPYWTVTGTAPAITVSPSIDDQSPARPWHGWIRDGHLVEA